jgi:hypothetical protein
MKLDLVPVSNVDRAKAFYSGQVGFAVDLDVNADSNPRVEEGIRAA